MAAGPTRLGGTRCYTGTRDVPPPFPTATITVGADDWANQVINNVVGNSDNSKSPASPASDSHAAIKAKIAEKKRLFHADRLLELKNLPDGVSEQDIRLAFPDLDILRAQIDREDVRHRPGAKLVLKHPELLEDWPKARDNVFVKKKEVSVCVGSSDQWLCVARLPLRFTEEEFKSLVSSYGRVKSSFLVCSEITGHSKGYGLVKYWTSEAGAQAKHLLNGKEVNSTTIQVDWLNSTHITYTQLQSKCLYVDNLPPNYRDMAKYRKIFSVVKNPPYCQIAMRNGVLQDWGLVEFFDAMEAEKTQQELNGYDLNGYKIRVQFCIPGVNAINIYMSVVSAPETSRKGLIDEVPSSSVYSQLQKLGKQNPTFAQNLQNIIQTQIESIQSEASLQAASEGERGDLAVNANEQAALMILLTAHQQAQTGEDSILQNQEVVNVLQNLVCADQSEEGAQIDPYAEMMSIPSLQVALGQQATPPPDLSWGRPNFLHPPDPSSFITAGPPATETVPPPVIANNMNLLSNTQTLNELLGSLKSPGSSSLLPPPPPPPPTTSSVLPSPPTRSPPVSQPLITQPPQLPTLPDFSCPPPFPPMQPSPCAGGVQPPFQFLTPPPPLPQIPTPTLVPTQQFFLNPNLLYSPLMLPGIPVSAAHSIFLPPPPAQLIPQVTLPDGTTLLPGLAPAPPAKYPIELPTVVGPSQPSTPNNLKRKASIPPSPEESPEGRYIGQHSQGLGGHYADSYWSKKRIKYF